MHIHIQGICGTFMGGAAVLARALGHRVTGSDAKVYPPMSTQLVELGISLLEGYDPMHLEPRPDLVLIGNALSRGNPEVEAVLDRGLAYTSGAQWLSEQVLTGRTVLACAGTHGKTTTASMLAWILEAAGQQPGFLIGGVPENFGVSARLGAGDSFVIEADEYDTAFFDKRSKFVHYRPKIAVLNNLEFDHADIFPDIEAIKRQFHYFLRNVPGAGTVIVDGRDTRLAEVLEMGCWTPVQRLGVDGEWDVLPTENDGSRFRVRRQGRDIGSVAWELIGRHNMMNALAAIAAAQAVDVPVDMACAALADFRSVKRRLEIRGCINGVTVYDDFAHHPTEIAATLEALRAHVGEQRIIAVLDPRSNTMRLGVHQDSLASALTTADKVLLFQQPNLKWDLHTVSDTLNNRGRVYQSVDAILSDLANVLRHHDHVLIMSNGGFDNIHDRLLGQLQNSPAL
jgi:UDP-N-acetylmuramate: L-alanyl-gamma-D-glutamyl-meso-diaminopimelate ligase